MSDLGSVPYRYSWLILLSLYLSATSSCATQITIKVYIHIIPLLIQIYSARLIYLSRVELMFPQIKYILYLGN